MQWKMLALAVAASMVGAASVNAADFQGDVFTRSTTSFFSNTEVTSAERNQLLAAAFSAPTGLNQHGLEFIVLKNRAEVEPLAKAMPNQKALRTANFVIVVLGNTKDTKTPIMQPLDAGLAVQAILTQAGHLKLQTHAMTLYPMKDRAQKAAEVLGFPEYVTPYMMVAVGHSSSDAMTSASTAYFNKAQVHEGKW